MKTVPTKIDGRWYMVKVPDEEVEEYFSRGLIVGPPDLSSLNLPEDVEAKLHNELFVRGLITRKDAVKKRNDLFAALQAALSVDTEKVLRCYRDA